MFRTVSVSWLAVSVSHLESSGSKLRTLVFLGFRIQRLRDEA